METKKMTILLTQDAVSLIKNLKDFDQAEFNDWFMSHVTIGVNNILQYVMEKEKSKPQIVTPQNIEVLK